MVQTRALFNWVRVEQQWETLVSSEECYLILCMLDYAEAFRGLGKGN